jgi:CubicO group peptidase (beta-lactamase class C family)
MRPRPALTAALTAATLLLTPTLAGAQLPDDPGTPPPPPAPTNPVAPPVPDPQVVPAPDPGQPPAGPGDLAAEPPLDVQRLVQEIRGRLIFRAVGFGYAVTRNGEPVPGASGGLGVARRSADGRRFFQSSTRIEVMSVTKPVTAIALQRLLLERGISVDAPVGQYLPAGWARKGGFATKGPNRITFAHLLLHTSGANQALQSMTPAQLAQTGNSWDGVKFLVGYGATPAARQYKNANYALIRVLIAQLYTPQVGGPATAPTKTDYAMRTLAYVNSRLFIPAGIAPVTCWETDDATAALAYDVNDAKATGALVERDGSNRQHCGGHAGLHLSADDLARLMSRMRSSEAILPSVARTAMFSRKLGWDPGSDGGIAGSAGLFWHAGDGFYSGKRETHSCVLAGTQGYEVALVLNSKQTSGVSQCRILIDAFNAARGA